MAERPTNPLAGLRHVALFVEDLEACEHFYVDLLGMAVEWRPDDDNVYLCGGCDNLALHRWKDGAFDGAQRLDHIGFIVDRAEDVDQWATFLQANGVMLKSQPRTHRDGARSFYCLDPAGVVVQVIHHPPISGGRFVS
ncbi:MAG: VOC family protein [Alcanivoracaceae bacterium]|mgnify:CR=1 FL=1|jgi:catechol 2,3-dioxygenase-like lactoylglutathione lyase family enzyme|nr:VOC family protein [Alcanivoracaceae bacterium]